MKEKKLIYFIACIGIIVTGGMIVSTFYNSVAATADKGKTIYKRDELVQYLGKDVRG